MVIANTSVRTAAFDKPEIEIYGFCHLGCLSLKDPRLTTLTDPTSCKKSIPTPLKKKRKREIECESGISFEVCSPYKQPG